MGTSQKQSNIGQWIFLSVVVIGIVVAFVVTRPQTITPTTSTETYLDTRDLMGYPVEYRNNFLGACVNNGGTNVRCECSLNVVQLAYSYPEAVEYEKTGYPTDLVSKIRNQCG